MNEMEPVRCQWWLAAGLIPLFLNLLRDRQRQVSVSQLWLFPVKSCGGFRVKSATITAAGLQHDRQWAIIRMSDGIVQTVRSFARLATVMTSLTGTQLHLKTVGGSDVFSVPLTAEADVAGITAHKPGIVTCDVPAVYCAGSQEWIRQWLGRDGYGLVHLCAEGGERAVQQQFGGGGVAEKEDQCGGFHDWAAVHAVSSSSLQTLNDQAQGGQSLIPCHLQHLAAAMPSPAARSSETLFAVLAGGKPYAEEHWAVLKIGSQLRFRGLLGTPRCTVPTFDINGEQPDGHNPTSMLRKHQMAHRTKQVHGPFAKRSPDFGSWMACDQKEGTLSEGQLVQV